MDEITQYDINNARINFKDAVMELAEAQVKVAELDRRVSTLAAVYEKRVMDFSIQQARKSLTK